MGLETTEIITMADGGLTKYWIENSKVLVYTFYNNQRETIDTWVEDVIWRLHNTPSNVPVFLLYDVSRIFMTPYMRERVDAIGTLERRDFRSYYAIILPPHLSGEMIKNFLRQEKMQDLPIELDFFQDFPSAIQWLRAMLSKEEI